MRFKLGIGTALSLALVACSSAPPRAPVPELRLERFREAFNTASDRTRVLVLLSPT